MNDHNNWKMSMKPKLRKIREYWYCMSGESIGSGFTAVDAYSHWEYERQFEGMSWRERFMNKYFAFSQHGKDI